MLFIMSLDLAVLAIFWDVVMVDVNPSFNYFPGFSSQTHIDVFGEITE